MLAESAFFHVFMTLGFYVICTFLQKKCRMPWFNPLLMSIVFTVLMILGTNTRYEVYEANTKLVSYLLTPATVCLAVPLYEKLSELKKNEEQYELCEDNDDASDKELAKKVAENDELAAISAYANELEARLKEKEAKIATLEKALDASTAAEDNYYDIVKEAEERAEEAGKALALSEERLKNCRELLLKSDKKISVLSEALSKALAFIASLNGVIADALKV